MLDVEFSDKFEEKSLVPFYQDVSRFNVSGKRSGTQFCFLFGSQERLPEDLSDVTGSRARSVMCFIFLDVPPLSTVHMIYGVEAMTGYAKRRRDP